MGGIGELKELGSRLRCPACGGRDSFTVELWQNRTLYPDGTLTEGDEGPQWDGASPCRCGACDHMGSVADFTGEDEPWPTPS